MASEEFTELLEETESMENGLRDCAVNWALAGYDSESAKLERLANAVGDIASAWRAEPPF